MFQKRISCHAGIVFYYLHHKQTKMYNMIRSEHSGSIIISVFTLQIDYICNCLGAVQLSFKVTLLIKQIRR